MTPGEFRPSPRALLSAVVAVMSVYVYFLIFAQFGFLQGLLEATGRTGAGLRPVLAAMGASGIAASALTAWGYRVERARSWLAGSLGVAGGAATPGEAQLTMRPASKRDFLITFSRETGEKKLGRGPIDVNSGR